MLVPGSNSNIEAHDSSHVSDKLCCTTSILNCGKANVSNSDLTSILPVLLLFVGLAQLLG